MRLPTETNTAGILIRSVPVPATVGLVSLSVHDASGKIAGIRQNERRVAEDAVDLLVLKLHHWHAGPSPSPRLQLVRGEWCDGLSAPGAGRARRALIV